MLYFATGNKHKFDEAQAIIPELIKVNLDLPEIQSLDSQEIVRCKLQAAFKEFGQPLIVDDTGLYLDCLNGFPGPMIKHFLAAIGPQGIFELTQKYNSSSAQAKATIGYINQLGKTSFFEGVVSGRIVKPTGQTGFGWDPIFLPDSFDQTYAQMTIEQKNQISHRFQALESFRKFFGSTSG